MEILKLFSDTDIAPIVTIASYLGYKEGFTTLRVVNRWCYLERCQALLLGFLLGAYGESILESGWVRAVFPVAIGLLSSSKACQVSASSAPSPAKTNQQLLELFQRLLPRPSDELDRYEHLAACTGCSQPLLLVPKRFTCLTCGSSLCISCTEVHPESHVLVLSANHEEQDFVEDLIEGRLCLQVRRDAVAQCKSCQRYTAETSHGIFHFIRKGAASCDVVSCLRCWEQMPLRLAGDSEHRWGPLFAMPEEVVDPTNVTIHRSCFCDYCGHLIDGEVYKSTGVIDFDMCSRCFAAHQAELLDRGKKHKGFVWVKESVPLRRFNAARRLSHAMAESMFFTKRRSRKVGETSDSPLKTDGQDFTEEVELPPWFMIVSEVQDDLNRPGIDVDESGSVIHPHPRVFKCQSLNTGCYCAIKVAYPDDASLVNLEPTASASESEQQLFDLAHPNVLSYTEAGSIDGPPAWRGSRYLASAWCPGNSIEHIMLNSAKLYFQPNAVRRLARGILSGLAYLHSKGLVHGNLHPRNILQSHTGDLVLGDHKLALQVLGLSHSTCWDAINFMAPELIVAHRNEATTNGTGEAKPTAASDIWSFGSLLLFLITSRRRWVEWNVPDSQSLHVILESMKEDEFVPYIIQKYASRSNSKSAANRPRSRSLFGFSDLFFNLLKRTFQVDPSARPTAAELLRDPLFLESDATVDGASVPEPQSDPAETQSSRDEGHPQEEDEEDDDS
jgi:serine/threonine protein kinase